jgi:RND family efflux transporter MFP subunit
MNPHPQTVEQPDGPPAVPDAEPLSDRLRDFQVADHERRGVRGGRGRRRLVWLLVLLVLVGGGVVGYYHRQANQALEADVFVFTGKPGRDVLLDLSGFVVPRTKVVISPQVGGIVSKVLLPEEGKMVKTGDPLFEIDDTRYKAEYVQAQAALATAAAQLEELKNGREEEEKAHATALYEQAKVQEELASLEYERARKLYPASIGKAEFDRAMTTYRDAKMAVKVQKAHRDLIHKKTRSERIAAAEAEVKRAGANLERAKYFLDKTRIYAPADSEGKPRVFTVLQKNVNPGESIQADLVYTALCTLADLSEMEAEVDVQERDLHLVKKGGSCEVIADAYPDRPYRARVGRWQPMVNRQRGVVQVKVVIDNPDAFLLPDMNARVLFLKESSDSLQPGLPRIPARALVPGSDPPAVFVLDGSTARLRPVTLGATVGDAVEVRSGLQPDDKILLPGTRPLQDGRPVRVRGPGLDGPSSRKDAL